MDSETRRALKTYNQVFGSFRKSGELKKTPVWLTVNDGRVEFITPGDSWKAKRARRNPRVICFLGSENGPALEGRAEVLSDPAGIRRVYRAYWKTHPFIMLILGLPIWLRVRAGRHVLVRVHPDEPNPLAGLTDPPV